MRSHHVRLALLLILGLHFGFDSKASLGQEPTLESYEQLVNRVAQLENAQQNQVVAQQNQVIVERAQSPNLSGGYLKLETVVVEPRFSTNTAGAIQDTGILGAGETSFTHDFSSRFKISPRIEFGYAPQPEGWGLRSRLWHFEHDSLVGMVGDIEVNFADDPDIAIDDNGLGISALQSTELTVFDMEASSRTDLGGVSVLGGAGIRWAEVQNNANWTDLQPMGERASFNNEFRGFGPTIFLEADKAWSENQSFFIKTRGSILAGQHDLLVHSSRDATLGPADVIQVTNENGFVPVLDFQIGTRFLRDTPLGQLEFSIAWESQAWFNSGVAAANEAGGKDSDDFQVQRTADMFLNGFNFGITLWR